MHAAALPSDDALDRLASALADERRALLDHDIELLVRSTHDKLAALRRLEADLPGGRGTVAARRPGHPVRPARRRRPGHRVRPRRLVRPEEALVRLP